ncbi:helix-turn-helix domain-containing protein, partial [Pseudomonas aeruginosa]|uniref:helix-turn-helix domain-containing protein n=1 Tax=Pseudomonas aeruginosa TaxID=287 RepID=UPI001958F523
LIFGRPFVKLRVASITLRRPQPLKNTRATGSTTMIGNRLREERLRLEMSQDAFSQHCGVKKNTQISYEKGRRSPDTTYLLKAIEIGVDVLYVVTGRHVPAAVKALTQEQLDILNYMSGMSEQNRADLVRVGRAMYDANQFRRMAPANSLS